MYPQTKMVRAAMTAPKQGEPLAPGPTFAAIFYAAGDPTSSPYTYGRYHNPTWTRFEAALGELEEGIALSFASGMAASCAVLGVTLRPGDVVVLPSDGYYTTRLLATNFFGGMGVQVRLAATGGNAQLAALDGAKLLWLETPANPGLDVCDIAAATKEAHARGVLVAVDNTTASVLGQQPLKFGADFSLASDTKALTGHGDLVLGHVAVRESGWAEKLQSFRNLHGAVPGPMEIWLAHRSLSTFYMRLEQQCSNAMAVAEYLATRSDITGLRYPGLRSDQSYEIASRQMQFFGPVIAFVLPDRAGADRFLSACKLIIEASSFGAIHTTAERRARWGGDDIAEGFIRLSVGCEDRRDIIADLAQALDASC